MNIQWTNELLNTTVDTLALWQQLSAGIDLTVVYNIDILNILHSSGEWDINKRI